MIRNENINGELKLQHLIASNQLKAVAETLQSWAVPEIADLLIDLDKPHQILVYRALPRQRAADMFAYL
ncbi:MAG: magnesium transporter, partial [Verrucomicrobiota bacterium]|nr:magnesium transporter [Verrucomicrobiota bacterium]